MLTACRLLFPSSSASPLLLLLSDSHSKDTQSERDRQLMGMNGMIRSSSSSSRKRGGDAGDDHLSLLLLLLLLLITTSCLLSGGPIDEGRGIYI